MGFTPQDIWDMTIYEIKLAIAGHQEKIHEDRINVWKSMRRQTAVLVNTMTGLISSKSKPVYDTDIVSLSGDNSETTAQIDDERKRNKLSDEQIQAILARWDAHFYGKN